MRARSSPRVPPTRFSRSESWELDAFWFPEIARDPTIDPIDGQIHRAAIADTQADFARGLDGLNLSVRELEVFLFAIDGRIDRNSFESFDQDFKRLAWRWCCGRRRRRSCGG